MPPENRGVVLSHDSVMSHDCISLNKDVFEVDGGQQRITFSPWNREHVAPLIWVFPVQTAHRWLYPPFPSNSFHDWRIVDTVIPVQQAFWGSDLNWMSAVKASQEAVGGWCHSWRLCRIYRISSPSARGIQNSPSFILSADLDKMRGILFESCGWQSGSVLWFSFSWWKRANNARSIIMNGRYKIWEKGCRHGGQRQQP